MTTRIIETEYDRHRLIKYLETQNEAVTVTITKGKHRTTQQNRLQRQWINDLAPQLGETSENVRAIIKLHFGIPILRNENEAFKAEYDKVIKPLPYEAKLSLMKEPLSWPVTSIMTTKQKKTFLDEVYRFYSVQGHILTDPEGLKWEKAA